MGWVKWVEDEAVDSMDTPKWQIPIIQTKHHHESWSAGIQRHDLGALVWQTNSGVAVTERRHDASTSHLSLITNGPELGLCP